LSRLKELAEIHNSDAFEEEWESALNADLPVAELLEALTVFSQRGEETLPVCLAELALEKMDSENSDMLFEFAKGVACLFQHSEVIATVLVETLRDKYLLYEPLEAFISVSGILSDRKPLCKSWARLKELLMYQRGNFLLHKDFGPGEIIRVSRSSFTIDFQRSQDHDMTMEAMLDSTKPIPADSLQVLKWKHSEEFETLLNKGGEPLLKIAFRDLAVEDTLKEINLLKLLSGSDIQPKLMWKTLKAAASESSCFMDMGDSIIPADNSSLLAQVEAVLAIRKLPLSEKTKTIIALIKAAPRDEEALLESLFDQVVNMDNIENGAVFELAWLCSGRGTVQNFKSRVLHLIETKAIRVERAMGEIHSLPCTKLYLELFFSKSPENLEIGILLDKLPRTMRELAADHAVHFNPDVHAIYVLQALGDPGDTEHFMWALERAARLGEYMEPRIIVEMALKNLNFAKSEMQRRICSLLVDSLRPQLEQHISMLDTRKLEALTEALEENIGAQESGLVLLARRELSGRRTGGFTNIKKFWEDEVIFSSRAGIARRMEEIENLRAVQIPNAAKSIAEAASHGDLSENAEYAAALEKRDFLLEMLNRYTKEITLLRPYPVGQISTEIISPATRVIMESMDTDSDLRIVYVVGPMDADSENGYINYKAPLGAALLGLSKGDTVQLPRERDSLWRITEISLMEEYM
jgi:transcription elongation factor GreA